MCGLVGIAGKLEFKDEHVMKHLLYLDMWRGKDSTGMAALKLTGDVGLAKIASHPIDLFDLTRFKSILAGTASSVFLGHNRHMTKGAINSVNAHPFIFDHIVGAHNGTLYQSSHGALERLAGETFEVDSQAIFAAIAKVGIKKVAPVLSGAWALTWIDTVEGTLNFLRNDQRDLWFAWSEDRNKLLWASEFEFIAYAAKSGAQPVKLHTDAEGFRYFRFEENIHYKFDISALRLATKETPYKPKATEMKGREVVANSNVTPFDQDLGGDGITMGNPHISTKNSTTTSRGTKTTQQSVKMLGTPEDPFAGMLARDIFEEIASNGCSFCRRVVKWGETGLVLIEKADIILCGDCHVKDENSNQIIVPDIKLYM